MIVSMKNGQGIENHFVGMMTDNRKKVLHKVRKAIRVESDLGWNVMGLQHIMNNDNDDKVKDIRLESSLGYQDVKKRDKRSLMDRIKEFFVDIKDFPENI